MTANSVEVEFWFGTSSSNIVGYAAGDAGATPQQSTMSLCWDGDLAACLFLFCNLLALGFLLCFQTKRNLAQLLLRQHQRKSVVTC